jgi:hypothetical protein
MTRTSEHARRHDLVRLTERIHRCLCAMKLSISYDVERHAHERGQRSDQIPWKDNEVRPWQEFPEQHHQNETSEQICRRQDRLSCRHQCARHSATSRVRCAGVRIRTASVTVATLSSIVRSPSARASVRARSMSFPAARLLERGAPALVPVTRQRSARAYRSPQR